MLDTQPWKKRSDKFPFEVVGMVNMNDMTVNKLNFLSLCPKDPQQASSLEAFCWVGAQFSAPCRSKQGCASKSKECFHLHSMSHAIVLDRLTSRQYNFFCHEAWSRGRKSKRCHLLKQGLRCRGPVQRQNAFAPVGPGKKTKHRPKFPWSVCVEGPLWATTGAEIDSFKQSGLKISEMQQVWDWLAWSADRESLQQKTSPATGL